MQLLLTLSFQEPVAIANMLDLAEIAGLYLSELPIFGQIGRAGPMPIDPNEVIISMGSMPRVSLTSADARYNVFLQEDRLSFGWNRTALLDQSHDYPGFRYVYSQLRDYVSRLADWAGPRGQTISPNVGEVVYTDAFLLEDERQISDIYTAFTPPPATQIIGFTTTWNQAWPGERAGYLTGTIAGPNLSPEGVANTTLESTGRFWTGGNWDACDLAFEEAHDAITALFQAVVKPAARAKSAG